MLDVLRPAFWALCLGLTLPLGLFLALDFADLAESSRGGKPRSRVVTQRVNPGTVLANGSVTVPPSAARPTAPNRIVRLEPIQPEEAVGSTGDDEVLWEEQNQLAYELADLRDQMRSMSASQQKQQLEQLHQSTQLLNQIHQASKLQELETRIRDLSDGPVRSAQARTISATETVVEPSATISVELDEETPGRLHLDVRQADLADALRELARATGKNLVVVPPVTGQVTLRLELVTFETALEALLTAGNLEAVDDGTVTTIRLKKAVVEPVSASMAAPVQDERVVRVFRPGHVRASDVRKLIEPMLTPGTGQVSLVAHERDDNAPEADRPEAILVRDRAEVVAAIDQIVREADTPPLQVQIEARVLSVRLTDQMKNGINFQLIGATKGPSPLPEDGLGNDACADGECPAGVGEPGFRYGTVHAHIPQVLNALERIADLSVIAAPQIVTVNGQQAELQIGEELGYRALTTTGPVTVDGVKFVETGTRIRLRPRVSPDGLIRVDIRPLRRTLSSTKACDPPSVSMAGMDTQVLVRDGDTVLIGGIVEETVREQSAKVPVLGSLPLVGGVFRKSVEQLERSEVLVLLTPRVIHNADPTLSLAGRVPEAERRHQLMREGQSLSNRRQTARRHYERALAACRKGDLATARHEARDALELDKTNPRIVQLHDSLERASRWSARPVVPAAHVVPMERPPVIPPEAIPAVIPPAAPTNTLSPVIDPYPQLIVPDRSPTSQPSLSPPLNPPLAVPPRGIAPPDQGVAPLGARVPPAAGEPSRRSAGVIVPASRGVITENTRPLPQPRRSASPPRGKVLR